MGKSVSSANRYPSMSLDASEAKVYEILKYVSTVCSRSLAQPVDLS
jgi:hypothetical protein